MPMADPWDELVLYLLIHEMATFYGNIVQGSLNGTPLGGSNNANGW